MSSHKPFLEFHRLEESMCHKIDHWVLCAFVLVCFVTSAAAQAQPVSGQSDSVIVVEKPTYVTINLEAAVNRPASEVWKRVGKWCDVSEWLQIAAGCKIVSGKDGEVGAVRTVGNEVIVAKTEFSYTYTQTPRVGRPYNLYHGTLEVRPATPTTSKILYTLLFDNSMLPDEAAREKDKATRTTVFTRALANMKTLAEGGTLPPPPSPR
jgi:polyketide cyclase/dehydrase/lipid transport protein